MPFLRRWSVFNLVGIIGAGVQLAVLGILAGPAGLPYLPATALAVEAAILHNFAWHERWTWADRIRDGKGRPRRLIRFHATNGAISIVGNLLLMRLLVGSFGLGWLPANLAAILVCSLVNYLAGDRYVFASDEEAERRGTLGSGRKVLHAPVTTTLLLAFSPAPLSALELKPEAVAAWERYVRLTERRIERELASGSGFLALDFQAAGRALEDRALLRRGGIVVVDMQTRADDGSELGTPSSLIHHWRGAVFIPNARLDDVLSRVRSANPHDHRQEDVLESRVLARDADSLRLYLKLVRRKIITVTYNTEHDVRYRRHGPARASSRSTAIRIAELADAGTPDEREKTEGRDSGFLWRLNSYWRYEQAEGGVIVECESISLSRNIPFGLEILVRSLIQRVARESMSRTLEAIRSRFA